MINYWKFPEFDKHRPHQCIYWVPLLQHARGKIKTFFWFQMKILFQVFIIWTSDVTSQEMWKRKLTSIQETINNGNNFSLKCHIVSVVQTNAVSYNTLYLYIFSCHPSEAFLWFYIYVCSRVPLVPRNVMVFQFFVSRHNFLWNHRLLMIYPSTP